MIKKSCWLLLFLCFNQFITLANGRPAISFLDESGEALPNFQLGRTTVKIDDLEPGKAYELRVGSQGRVRTLKQIKGPLEKPYVVYVKDLALEQGLADQILDTKTAKVIALSLFSDDVQVARKYTTLTAPLLVPGVLKMKAIHRLDYEMGEGETTGWGSFTYGGSLNGSKPKGLVMIAHGNGFAYDDYSYLEQALVGMGFGVASVGSPDDASIKDRGQDILVHLEYVYERWGEFLSDTLVFIGHSRGGEAIIHAANRLAEQGRPGASALICLAPSYEEQLETPHFEAASAMLILYGTHDDDVTNEVGIGFRPNSPFRLFDRTWIEPFFDSAPHHKSMIVIHGGDHLSFSDWRSENNLLNSSLPPNLQQWATAAYVEMFIRWRLMRENAFAPYFQDGWHLQPPGEDEPLRVSLQYETTRQQKIHDFEKSPFGARVPRILTKHSKDLFFSWGPAYEMDAHSPHDTGVALIGWKKEGFLQIKIPGRYRDFRPFSHLTFRVGQVYGDKWNLPPARRHFKIRISSPKRQSDVDLHEFGEIPYPVVVQGQAASDWDQTVSDMRTIRIPLEAFTGVDLGHVTGIQFIFHDPKSAPTGLIILDDLALSITSSGNND